MLGSGVLVCAPLAGARERGYMKHRALTAGAAGVAIRAAAALGAVGDAGATSAVPSKVVVKQKPGLKMVTNPYIRYATGSDFRSARQST